MRLVVVNEDDGTNDDNGDDRSFCEWQMLEVMMGLQLNPAITDLPVMEVRL